MFCTHCGVRLEPHRERCPLCGMEELQEEVPGLTEYPENPQVGEIPSGRKIVFRFITLLLVAAGAVVLVVDGLFNGGVSWSPLVIYSLGTAWVFLALPFTEVPPWGAYLLDVIAVAALLYGIAHATGGTWSWYLDVALPILLVCALVIAVTVVAVQRVRGGVRLAVSLAMAGVVCVGVDLVIRNYRGQPLHPGWSGLVLLTALPAALFFLIFHATVLRYIDLRRRLHL
ncbi:hypothetical protein SAMN05920897_10862 [Alkalispirochaeta americana]|uniref:Zinc-ribbon domain-containing protein n=1 Tax=Alkalispirochaeta americana TaxID=159291 RepID=A0A1N6SFX9_9SPIO|nr:DUF6320 domain-containing protein [Alkalispirochaeta americana]SIQ39846.1 hypothetical protein SAMN05920897_10862 [Alkalispirochaeta americana]